MACSCKHDNESSVSMKWWECFSRVQDFFVFQKSILRGVKKLVNGHIYGIPNYASAFLFNKQNGNSSEGATLNVGLRYSVLYKSVCTLLLTGRCKDVLKVRGGSRT
jgi:hypothetical protein